jgi:hypothetical protein
MSPALDADETGIEWPSNFSRKVVLADFRKTFFDDLEAAAPDFLIIDLMSERFDLYRARRTYVTRSWDLVQSGFDTRCGHRLERVARETMAVHEAWCRKTDEFADVLNTRFPDLPVVLHRAYWTLAYRDRASIRPFPREWQKWITVRNRMLEACHAHLERQVRNLIPVEPRRRYLADPHHFWGPGSSHYETGYYEEVREQFGAALRAHGGAVAA